MEQPDRRRGGGVMHAIEAKALSKSFGPLPAVRDLSLTVGQGEIFGLVGPDGAGKTTAIRLLTSILRPTSGEAWIAGKSILTQPEALKEDIGYVSQRFGLYPDLTVMENIEFYADIYGVPGRGRREKIERLLSFSNMTPFKRRHAGRLSGGMKQKLGLVCALIHRPRILFLDEPTNGVDPVSRRDFWRILYQLAGEGVTVFVSTAYLDEAERCNRLGLMHQGELLAVGTPEEVKRMLPDTILEIRPPDPRKAFTLLRRSLTSGSINLFGDRIHLIAREAEVAIREAGRILASAGLQVGTIRAIEPALEDVFLSVLRQTPEQRENERI
jgi:ABC-2 type transport system ATP-binding protein